MSQENLLKELRMLLIAFLAYASGKGWVTATDAGLLTQIATPIGLLAGPWIWSVYTSWGKKLVPHDSVAIAKSEVVGAAAPGLTVGIPGDTVKVVGCLIAFLFVMHSSNVMAQGLPKLKPLTGNIQKDFGPQSKPAPSTSTANGLSGVLANITSALQQFNDGVSNVEKTVVDTALNDVNNAILDASNHNDQISLPCWQSIKLLLDIAPSEWPTPPTNPIGIALGIQIQRDFLNSIMGTQATSLKVACAALWGDQLQIITQVGALLGVRIATGGAL
jgi:hypothetical protein